VAKMLSVVVGELGQRQQVFPVVLLMIDEDPEVLLKDLINPLCLPHQFSGW